MPTRTRRRLREHTVGLLARKWTLRIAVTLSGDTKRHSELAKCLPGITQKVLTETLREMERILSIIIESGPELDPAYLASLHDYLDYLIDGLNVPLNDPVKFIKDMKENMGVNDDIVNRILSIHTLPEEMRHVIEKLVAGRHEGLSDKAIYRRLARVYHPDQTYLDLIEAEIVFKFIGQRLFDQVDGFGRLFDS